MVYRFPIQTVLYSHRKGLSREKCPDIFGHDFDLTQSHDIEREQEEMQHEDRIKMVKK
jgi:hypothetical protein